MVLVDTSVWIDHLRQSDQQLIHLLNTGQVLIHPFIIGELACGTLKNRKSILSLLNNLNKVKEATNEEVNYLIEKKNIMGKGIGYIDAHLLASSLLDHSSQLWTRDKRLNNIAIQLSISFTEQH